MFRWYEFTAQNGYALYSTPTLDQVAEKPSALRMWVYGDGSGHELALRMYDSTDERFVTTVGPIDWTGWKELVVSDVEAWQHYLGDDDGMFDPPAETAALQLTYKAGGPLAGAIYVDDIRVSFGGGATQTTDFEIPLRALRLSMLGEQGTTVVTGEGLGPDLQLPVPLMLGPAVTSVVVNAVDTAFVRDGNYVILNLEPNVGPDGGVLDDGGTTDGGGQVQDGGGGAADSEGGDGGCGCSSAGAGLRGWASLAAVAAVVAAMTRRCRTRGGRA
jgi:hypothetical protein